jgi:hypothetical protein
MCPPGEPDVQACLFDGKIPSPGRPPLQALRFKVGARVEVNVGQWQAGTVIMHWYRELLWETGKCESISVALRLQVGSSMRTAQALSLSQFAVPTMPRSPGTIRGLEVPSQATAVMSLSECCTCTIASYLPLAVHSKPGTAGWRSCTVFIRQPEQTSC